MMHNILTCTQQPTGIASLFWGMESNWKVNNDKENEK